MNKLNSLIITILALIISHPDLSGQKLMKLDNELKSNSTPLTASRKGFSSIGKYEFGTYKIISGKSGWRTTKSSKKLFSFESKSESKTKSSFVLVANNKDTLHVNISLNTKVSETDLQQLTILNQSDDNFIAVISPDADTTDWKMVVSSKSGANVKDLSHAEGVLTDGTKAIQIREVKILESGKSSLLNSICGYEFTVNDVVVAAVQTSIDTFLKRIVWIRNDMDEKMKTVFAAAAASLMIYTDYSMTGQ